MPRLEPYAGATPAARTQTPDDDPFDGLLTADDVLDPDTEMSEDAPMPPPPSGYSGYFWVVTSGKMTGIVCSAYVLILSLCPVC